MKASGARGLAVAGVGTGHVQTAGALSELAGCLDDAGEHEEALEKIDEAIAILEGTGHGGEVVTATPRVRDAQGSAAAPSSPRVDFLQGHRDRIETMRS